MKLFITILIAFTLVGCAGISSIRIDGTYKTPDGQEITGGTTWEFDKDSSKKEGVPVFKDESGNKAVLVPEAQIKVLNEYHDQIGTKCKTVTGKFKEVSDLYRRRLNGN